MSEPKKRRLHGACDVCRQKKIRCDSAKMQGNICTNCLEFGFECTHNIASKGKRGPFRHRSTTEEHHQSCGNTQTHDANNLWPGDASKEAIRAQVAAILSPSNSYLVPEDHPTVLQTLIELARYIKDLEQELATLRHSMSQGNIPGGMQSALPLSSAPHADTDSLEVTEAMNSVVLSDDLNLLSNSDSPARFYGNSSSISLLQTAVNMRKESTSEGASAKLPALGTGIQRPEFWSVHQWQRVPDEYPALDFPDNDLLHTLVDLFFTKVNILFPLLHRPTFEESLSQGLHTWDQHFGGLVLAVCALAARCSDDPRVFSNVTTDTTEQSSGWKWFNQIRPFKTSYVTPPSVYELQLCIISIMYLQGTSTPEAVWTLIGHGIRLAQDVGAHRKKFKDHKTVEGEIWKRAFWALVMVDVYASTALGRPRATNANDFDLDMLVECDEEYWEHPDPEQAFKQPPGIPARVAYWIATIKLTDILGFAHRTIFAIKESDTLMRLDFDPPRLDEPAIVQIDSALNQWIDSIPGHLRWDPHKLKENQEWFVQSAFLYVNYYYVQILVHRPFISSRSDTSFPHLAICANAARATSHVAEVQARTGYCPMPNFHMAVFSAAVVLLMNVWGGRRQGLSTNPGKEMKDVYRCMNVLRTYEKRNQFSGRICDVIQQLISAGDLQYPSEEVASLKRGWDSEQILDSSTVPPALSFEVEPRAIASLHRVSRSTAPGRNGVHVAAESGQVEQPWNLPLHTNDLGRLPIHETFDFLNGYQALFDDTAWVGQFTPESAMRGDIATEVTNSTYPDAWHNAQPFASTSQGNPVHDQLGDTLAVWSNMPGGQDWSTWSAYVTSVEQSMENPMSGHPENP